MLSRPLPTLVDNSDDGGIRFVFGVACCAVPGAFPGRETRHQNVTGGSKPTVDWHDRVVLYPPLWSLSIRVFLLPSQEICDCSQNNLDIQEERPVFDIVEVVAGTLFDTRITA